jgi:hypothetical protein
MVGLVKKNEFIATTNHVKNQINSQSHSTWNKEEMPIQHTDPIIALMCRNGNKTVGSISDMVLNERHMSSIYNRGDDKSLVRPGRKQATATEDSDVHISYL